MSDDPILVRLATEGSPIRGFVIHSGLKPIISMWMFVGVVLTTFVPLFAPLYVQDSVVILMLAIILYLAGALIQRTGKTQIEGYWSHLQKEIPELELKKEITEEWDIGRAYNNYSNILIFIPLLCFSSLIYSSYRIKEDIFRATVKKVNEAEEVLGDLESKVDPHPGIEIISPPLGEWKSHPRWESHPANRSSIISSSKHYAQAKGVVEDMKDWKQISEEEQNESDERPPSIGELKNGYQEAQRAINLAEQEAEVLDEIELIEQLIELNLPDELREDAFEKVARALREVAQGKFDEARELANEAENTARSSVDHLIDRGNALAEKASQRHGQGDYESAIDTFEDALNTYEKALSLAPDLDSKDRVPDIRESIADTERNRDQSQMYDIVQEGENQVELAKQAFEKEEYERAIKAYENAHSIHTRAHDIAAEHGFDEEPRLSDTLGSIEQRLQAARISQIEAELGEAAALLNDDDYEGAEERFEELVDTIDEADIDDEEKRDSLRRRAQEGHLEAQIEQGRTKIDRAESQFEKRDYYAARETFEETTEYLEQVLSLASVYDFTEKKEEIAKLVQLCSENANQARQALYETGTETPELKSLDEIKPADITPEARAGQQDQPPPPREEEEVYQTQEYEFDLGAFTRQGSSDKIGNQLPEHERLNLIGAGGNAKVWHVRVEDTGDEAALKIPKWEGTLSKDVVRRFLREAETWSRIDDHENIATVYDWGFAAQPWLLMEYMDGGDLRPYVGSMSLDRALDVLIQIADALQYARGVDHLDIKPENILLDSDGTAKLADWGLAKVAFRHDNTDTQMGISPPYAAPEQVDRTLGNRNYLTDIYQLGVTGYELLTGQVPFDPEAPESLERRILDGEPRPIVELNPEIPPEIDQVLRQAMAADREDRYETAVQFRNALREVQTSIRPPE